MGRSEATQNIEPRSRAWFPFQAVELEIVLGILGALVTGLSLANVDREAILAVGALFVVVSYLAGLLVRAQEAGRTFQFLEGGGVRGEGYLETFRRAKRSLLLQHVDDDAPSEELLGLYRSLLDRGVLLRRTVFLRDSAKPESLAWIVKAEPHVNLEHRVVLPEQAELTRWSFAVVDEREVIISIPGSSALDGDAYSGTVLLRDVLILREPVVAEAFVRIHEHTWRRARPVTDPREFADVAALRRTAVLTPSSRPPTKRNSRPGEEGR